MKTVLIILAGVLVLILLTIAGYFGYKKYDQYKKSKIAIQNAKTEVATPVAEQIKLDTRPGTYELYDTSKLVLAKDGKVVLFFNAKWSKTSKQLDQELKNKVDKLPENFTILSVDYDKNVALRKTYDVPFENTFVQVDAEGNIINRWSGSEDMAEIIALAK